MLLERGIVRVMGWLSAAFLVTALVGVWAAYDQGEAWHRFVLIAIGLALMVGVALAGRYRQEQTLATVSLGSGLLAAVIGTYFLLAFDWRANSAGESTLIQQAGIWIQGHRPILPIPEDINGNVAGSILVLLLPLAVAGVAWIRSRLWDTRVALHGRPVWSPASRMVAVMAVIPLLAVALAVVALTLTGSRGAWIGLMTGSGVAIALGRFAHRRHSLAVFSVLACALLSLFWATVSMPSLDSLLSSLAGAQTMSRAALWRDMPALITDYPFTGSGLGSTMMVYSTYVVLLHVGYITHAHNLFLQMAIEQGVPGLLAFVGLFLVIGWRLAARVDGRSQIFRLAAIASLVALVVHGTVDAGVYASRAVPILFLPFGFALAETVSQRSDRGPRPAVPPARHALRTAGLTPALVLTFAVVFALVMVLGLLPVSRAAFQANLGAAAQTRAELSLYQWPAWPIQDALRRSPEVDLAPAIAHYQAALALNPRNVAANRRLGQIELSRGQYDAARQHFETAFAAAPGQRATRQLLGESYAISGEVERAASLWQTVDIDQGRLTLRQWWYEHIGEAARAQSITEAAKLARPQD